MRTFFASFLLLCLGLSVPPALVSSKKAIAAAATCNTSHDSNGASPSTSLFPGDSSGTMWSATSFVAGANYTACKVTGIVWRLGADPGFTLNTFIYTDSSGNPGTQIGTGSDNVAWATLPTTEVNQVFTNMSAAITSGATYWLVLKLTGTSPSDARVAWDCSGTAVTVKKSSDGSSWSTWTSDRWPIYTIYGAP